MSSPNSNSQNQRPLGPLQKKQKTENDEAPPSPAAAVTLVVAATNNNNSSDALFAAALESLKANLTEELEKKFVSQTEELKKNFVSKEELDKTKGELDKTNEELDKTNEELDKTNEELRDLTIKHGVLEGRLDGVVQSLDPAIHYALFETPIYIFVAKAIPRGCIFQSETIQFAVSGVCRSVLTSLLPMSVDPVGLPPLSWQGPVDIKNNPVFLNAWARGSGSLH